MHLIILALLAINSSPILSDFSNAEEHKSWKIVNDGVMGGKSKSELIRSKKGYAIFKGDVSLENNGGFASVRQRFEVKDISGTKTIQVKLRGDGKKYQFRLKRKTSDYYTYKFEFETTGEWETISVPLDEMIATYRGYQPDVPQYKAKELSEIGFLIANSKKESFQLEIKKIWLSD